MMISANVATTPSLTTFAGTLGDRPSPPDVGEVISAVKSQFPARPGYGDPYSVDDQQRVISAALYGGRTGAELTSAAAAVKQALPARPGYGDPYTKDHQLAVVTSALASWYELDSIGARIASAKSAMPARPGYGDPYTVQQQVDAIVAIYGQPFRQPGPRPTPAG